MKRIVLSLAFLMGVANFQFSTFNFQLNCAYAQVPYSYAPEGAKAEELAALGFGTKSGFVQGMTLFDPASDPALGRLQGREILGVRCYLRADYKQARQKRSAILAGTGRIDNIVQTTYADFAEGWNDVYFDTPITIGDEPLYLGLQVYETTGTPYPLVSYAPATVPQACWVNLGKTKWEEFTDRGTLLIAALLDDEAAEALSRTAYAQNTAHPQTVAPSRDFTGGLYIHNFAAEPIESVEVAMLGEGDTEPTLRTIELEEPIGPYGGTVVTTRLHSGSAEGTSVAWTASVVAINHETAQAGRPGTTQLYVTHDDFQRTPLIEEFTSQRCINCPQMAYFLDKALEEYPGEYVYVAHHAGFVEDVFTTQPDREVLYLFGGYANEYNPAIMYNRAQLDGENSVVLGIHEMSKAPYLQSLQQAADMPAMAEVNITVEGETVTVWGRVARDLATAPLYLSCYLVEDGMTASQYYQTGMDDPDAPSDLKEVFRHNGVILHHFTQEALGDRLTANADGTYSVTYPAVEKQGFGGTQRRLVAFVHKVDKDDLRNNQVLNATQRLLGADGIEPLRYEGTGRSEGEEPVYDLSGRRVVRPSRGLYIRHRKTYLAR